jgi:hypothetical protein
MALVPSTYGKVEILICFFKLFSGKIKNFAKKEKVVPKRFFGGGERGRCGCGWGD